jgi:hypothetical protein
MSRNYRDQIEALLPGTVVTKTEHFRVITVTLPDGTRRCFDRGTDALVWVHEVVHPQPVQHSLDPAYVAELLRYMHENL